MSYKPKFGQKSTKSDNMDDWINQEFARIGKPAPEKSARQGNSDSPVKEGGLSNIMKGFDAGTGPGNPLKNDILGSKPRLLPKKDRDTIESDIPIDPNDAWKPKPLKASVRPRKEEDNLDTGNLESSGAYGMKQENPIRAARRPVADVGEGKGFEPTPKIKSQKAREDPVPESDVRSSNIFTKPSIKSSVRDISEPSSGSSAKPATRDTSSSQIQQSQVLDQSAKIEFNESFYNKPFKTHNAVDKKKDDFEKIHKPRPAAKKEGSDTEPAAPKKKVKGQADIEEPTQKRSRTSAGPPLGETLQKTAPKNEAEDDYGDDFEKADDDDGYDDDFEEESASLPKSMQNTMTQPIRPNFSKIDPEQKRAAATGKPSSKAVQGFDSRSINFAESEVVQHQGGEQFVINKGEDVYVDPEKRMLQQDRVEYLREVVHLEYEDFNDMFELLPTSDFELYVNRIKSGVLKNSADQCNEDITTKEVQTEGEYQQDISTQCPDDRSKTVISSYTNTASSGTQTASTQPKTEGEEEKSEDGYKLVEFMQNVYPVFEELLSLSLVEIKERQATKLDNITLGFREDLKTSFEVVNLLTATSSYDGTSIFISYSIKTTFLKSNMPLCIVINYNGERPVHYFLSFSPITYLFNTRNFRNVLIGGSQDGSLILWDMRDSELRHRKDTHDLLQMLRDNMPPDVFDQVVFRLPNFSTDYMTDEGHSSPIVKISDYSSGGGTIEIVTLEEFGTVIFWNLVETNANDTTGANLSTGMSLNSRIKVIKTMSIQLHEISPSLTEGSLLCRDLEYDKSCSNIYVCNVHGIVKADRIGMTKHPKLFGETSQDDILPTALIISEYELFFSGYSNGAIDVFTKNYGSTLASLQTGSSGGVAGLHFPRVTLKNKKGEKKILQLMYYLFAADTQGRIFIFNFDKNLTSPVETIDLLEAGVLSERPKRLLYSRLTPTFDLELLYKTEGNQVIKVAFKVKKYIALEPAKIEKINQKTIEMFKTLG